MDLISGDWVGEFVYGKGYENDRMGKKGQIYHAIIL